MPTDRPLMLPTKTTLVNNNNNEDDESSNNNGQDEYAGLSSYEIARLEKIARNEDKLKSLGLLGNNRDAMMAASEQKNKRKRPPKNKGERQPSRKSTRLKKKQKIDYNDNKKDGTTMEVVDEPSLTHQHEVVVTEISDDEASTNTEQSKLSWSESFQKLQKYYDTNDHSNVPSCHADKQLLSWTCKQRVDYKSNMLREDRISSLESVDFNFATRRTDGRLDKRQEGRKNYKRSANGAAVKTCSHEGCTNVVVKGGVCKRHGAKKKKYICSHEGCTNKAQKGGVCIRHGAKVVKRKTCSHEGCTNVVVKGGVCKRHGAKVMRQTCSHEGCTKYAQKGGVCTRHGAKAKTCSHEEG